jgi:hypothetical protein
MPCFADIKSHADHRLATLHVGVLIPEIKLEVSTRSVGQVFFKFKFASERLSLT